MPEESNALLLLNCNNYVVEPWRRLEGRWEQIQDLWINLHKETSETLENNGEHKDVQNPHLLVLKCHYQ